MIQCCMFGHLEILKLILSALPNINLAFNDNEALRWACDGGKISIVKALMESRHPEVVPKPDFLVKALENGGERGVEIIKYLLNLKPLPPGSVSQELYVSDSVSPLAEQILDSTVTPTTDRELFIPSTTSPTAGEGYTMTTDIITQSTPPLPSTSSMVQEYIPPQIIDPSFNDNILIQMAAQKRYMELVEMLLLDPRIDPAANNNKLFHTAVETGNTNLLQLLLIDGRIKISREDIDQGFRLTSKNDKLSAFELLLKDPRASPLPTFRECLVGLLDIAFLELLIQDVRVDPSERDNFAIKHSIKNGRMELFEPLVRIKREQRQHVETLTI